MQKYKFQKPIIYGIVLLVLATFLLNNCARGITPVKTVIVPPKLSHTLVVRKVNRGKILNKMMIDIIMDLVKKHPSTKTLAVWRISTGTAGLDVEMIRKKLTRQLSGLNQFQVADEEQMSKVLSEYKLSFTGTISESSAVELGRLLGVDGFIDGIAEIRENQFILQLKLTETRAGKKVWSKTVIHEF